MGRNPKGRKHTHDLSGQAEPSLIGISATNEWREFVRETSTAKFYAIGFCVLCGGITFVGLVASIVFGSQKNFRLANLNTSEWRLFCVLQANAVGERTQALSGKMISNPEAGWSRRLLEILVRFFTFEDALNISFAMQNPNNVDNLFVHQVINSDGFKSNNRPRAQIL
jgi:hypothetical protein